MRKRLLLFLTLIAAIASSAFADEAFRTHRYDAFKPLEVNENSIVFVGNSITNMNEWRECFGNNPLILSRGNSGGLTGEWNANIESVIAGKPAKVFYKLGTNDLGGQNMNVPTEIVERIRTVVRRFKNETPNTKVYIQSILPCSKDEAILTNTNSLISQMITEEATAGANVEFVDIYNIMKPLATVGNNPYSYDRLHPTVKGYSLWCHAIANLVGVPCVLPEDGDELIRYVGTVEGNSERARASLFAALPVTSDDILFVGGEVVHGAEWHEYFDNNNVKSRGTKWGQGDLTIAQHLSQLSDCILGNHYNNQTTPSKIILYLGLADEDNDAFTTSFTNLLTGLNSRLATLNPENTTEIYAVSLLPWNNNTNATSKNEKIQAAVTASGLSNVHYVDITSMMENGAIPAKYTINSNPNRSLGYNYPSGIGYAKMAELIANSCGIAQGDNFIGEEKATKNREIVNTRTLLAQIADQGTGIFSDSQINIAKSALEGLNYDTSEATDMASYWNRLGITPIESAPDSGWYRVMLLSGSIGYYTTVYKAADLATSAPFLTNAASEYKQNSTNFYAATFGKADSESPAKQFFKITQDGSNTHIQSINGHYIQDNCLSATSAVNLSIPYSESAYGITGLKIGNWNDFSNNGPESPYLGGSSDATANRWMLIPVGEDEIDEYDVWTVEFIGETAESSYIGELPRVSMTDNLNKGIATVYNGGFFIVPVGSTLSANMFTVEGVTNENEPTITINDETMTIIVDYSEQEEDTFEKNIVSIDELSDGAWVKIRLMVGSGDTNNYISTGANNVLNVNEPYRQDANKSYSVRYGAYSEENPASGYFYVSKSGDDKAHIRSINGMYIQGHCINARTGSDINLTHHASVENAYRLWNNTSAWHSYTPAGYNENPLIGGSSSSQNFFSFSVVPDIEMAQYDVYTVQMNAATNGSEIIDDPRVAISCNANRGIDKVYNGGHFFVDKGTVLTPEMFTVTCQDESLTAAVSVLEESKTIIVDFNNISEGWYHISLSYTTDNNFSSTITDGTNFAINKEVELPHVANNITDYYPLRLTGLDNTKPALALIHVTPSSNTYEIQGLNGHFISGACTVSTTAPTLPLTKDANGFKIGGAPAWKTYTLTDEGNTENPTIGGSTGSVERWNFEKQDVSNFDIWNVSIPGAPEGANIRANTQLSLNADANITNLGITSVYDGGYFFFNPGTELNADMFTIVNGGDASPKVILDSENHTILVDFRAYASSATITIDESFDMLTTSIGDNIPNPIVTPDQEDVAPVNVEVFVQPETAATIEADGSLTINESGAITINATVTNPDGTSVSVTPVEINVLPNVENVNITANPAEGLTFDKMAIGDVIQAPVITPIENNPRASSRVVIAPASAAEIQSDGSIKIVSSHDFIIRAEVTNPNGEKAESEDIHVTVMHNVTSVEMELTTDDDLNLGNMSVGDDFTPVLTPSHENSRAATEFVIEPASAASADASGKITILQSGEFTIKAVVTNPDGTIAESAPQTVTVAPDATSATISLGFEISDNTHILIGDVITPIVTVQPAGNKATYELSFSPADAVEAVEGQEGSYTLLEAGALTITATIRNPHGDPFTQSLNINVENLSTEVTEGAEKIDEEKAEEVLNEIAEELGEELPEDVAENLKGTITLDLFNDQSVNQELEITLNTNFEIEETWTEVTSSNPNVAVYLGEGNRIQTVGVGKTLITIKVWRKQTSVATTPATQLLSRDGSEDSVEKGEPAAIAHYWMTVTDNALKLSVDRLRVEVGKQANVAIEAENADGYVWTVADTNIASITVVGTTITVSGLNPGQTTITGTRGSDTVTLDVTVFTYILGIDAVNADAASGRTAIFDLSGRRLSAVACPGLYIINGEKVYVK